MADRRLFGRSWGERRVSRGKSGFAAGMGSADLGDENAPLGPPGGPRSEALKRLQVGLFGIFTMILLVGLASIIGGQAELTEEAAVPNAAPTTEPRESANLRDPLADTGVVPDISVEPSPSPMADPLVLPPPPGGSSASADDQRAR